VASCRSPVRLPTVCACPPRASKEF
jgi:hypothetical protein